MTSTEARAPQVKTFEWWMLANFAMGAGYSAFVSLLGANDRKTHVANEFE